MEKVYMDWYIAGIIGLRYVTLPSRVDALLKEEMVWIIRS